MHEIKIRYKTMDEFEKNCMGTPFVITIDGVQQENVKSFAINLTDTNTPLGGYSYSMEKYMDYPKDFRNHEKYRTNHKCKAGENSVYIPAR